MLNKKNIQKFIYFWYNMMHYLLVILFRRSLIKREGRYIFEWRMYNLVRNELDIAYQIFEN